MCSALHRVLACRVLRSAIVIDVRQLAGALDLWFCMWEPDERERFETAVVRAMTDENPRATRLQALALCHVVGSPRLLNAAHRIAATPLFTSSELQALQIAAQPWRGLLEAGGRLRGNVVAVERMLARAVSDPSDRVADITLDWVDIRDLVTVAFTTVDARLFAEIERRISVRGNYQRGRAANVLGFRTRPATAAAASVAA
jgi:hypothetical protein